MSLVWHIAKKDLRRMALPVGFWLAFIVASAALFRMASVGENAGPAEVGAWLATMKIWLGLQVAGAFLIGYLLAGALVIEDELTGTTGFWMTRPIAGARLLGAKVVAAALLFVVAPALALVPVWLGSGFGWWQTAIAAGEFAMWQGVVTLLALGIASLAGSLAQFLVFTIGLAVAYVGCEIVSTWLVGGVTAAIYISREHLLEGGILVVAAVVLAQQFLTRRVARGWATIGLALAAAVVIRVGWPWDFWSGIAARADQWRLDDRPEDRAAPIIVAPSLSKWSRPPNGQSTMKVTAPWTKNSFYMPVLATADGSDATFKAYNGWQQVGLRAIGFGDGEGPITWHLGSGWSEAERWSDDGALKIGGELEIWSARATVLGEIPLREGGELSSGASRAKIVGLQRTGEQLDGIFIEEHDVTLALESDWHPQERDGRDGPNEKARHFDCYILVDRAKRRVQPLSSSDMGAVRLNALATGVRRLFVGGTESWAGAVVMGVRIERDHSFTRPFEVKGMVFEDEKRSP